MYKISQVMPKGIALLLILLFFSVGSLGALALQETHMVPMRDGVRLATDVYLPSGEGSWSTVLARTPYGRFKIDELNSRGYVVVTQDWRGYGGSDGVKIPFESDGWGELQDGYDTVEWIANQTWSNGNVGTWGGSALGITQNLMAGSYPPHLVCQHILAAASDMYSQMFFQGGVLRKSMVEAWWGIHGTQEHLADLLSHPNYDSRWNLMDSDKRVGGMNYPGLHVGGWYDIFSQGTVNAFSERQYGGGPGSKGNQKLVMGPWWHGGFTTTTQGELTFPSDSLYSDLWPDSIRLYDYWLKGIDNGYVDEPAIRYYIMGDVDDLGAPGNEWRSADEWPIPYSNFSLYLTEDGLRRQCGPDATRSYVYDPKKPVPTIGGPNLVLPAGPMDQRSVEKREDVPVYSTEPLEVPVEITGRIYVQLFASSSCPDTDFMAKLTDVYPDGRSMLVLDGAIRARHRNSMETEEFMDVGNVYEFWIDLWSTSIVFNKGHRIRLAITSSNDPRFDPNPNTGHPFRADGEVRIANNTVHMGVSHPSRVILPLTGPDSDCDGVYDILDPLPDEPGPLPTSDEMGGMIGGLDSKIACVRDPDMRAILEIASNAAKERLEEGNTAGAGHLLGIINATLAHDPYGITLAEARQIIGSALDRAGASAADGRFLEMLDCIRAGWMLGNLREDLEDDQGGSVLSKYLEETETLMNATGCKNVLRLADWITQPNVLMVAAMIEVAKLEGVSESDLTTIEGMVNSAKTQYLDWQILSSGSMLSLAKRRLDDLGITVTEPGGVTGFLAALICWMPLKEGWFKDKG